MKSPLTCSPIRIIAALFCSLFLWAGSAANAVTVTNFAIADTTLQEAFPDNNLGGGTTFTAGTRLMGGRTRALIEFDIANVPAGATINSASLTLTVTMTQFDAPNSTFALHRILADWGEGSGGDLNQGGNPAQPGEATWNHRLFPATPWSSPGGDFAPAASATQDIFGNATYTFTSANLAADVQTWLDNPGTNFGWLLLTQSEGTLTTIRRFAGHLAASGVPTLAIDYSIPSTPQPVLSNPVIVGGAIQFSFEAQAGAAYTVEHRMLAHTGTWTTLTNVPAPPSNTTIQVTDPLSDGSRYYRVRSP